MGSGKGKTRRTQTNSASQPKLKNTKTTPSTKTATTANTVKTKPEKWEEFVHSSGTQTMQLSQYYLGKNVNKTTLNMKDHEYEKIMAELFADQIATGALSLPRTLNADNIIFKMSRNNKRGKLTIYQNYMTITIKNEPGKDITILMPRFNFHTTINRSEERRVG